MVSWRNVSVLYAQYFGIPLLTLGIIGDILNIMIFIIVNTYRQTPSTFYLLCAVIGNLIHLSIALTTRILSIGYNYDLTRSSIFWCKLRQYLIGTYPPLALTCESLAAIDQFLVTSRNVQFRQLSTIKRAHRIVIGCFLFWHFHSLPFLFYNQIQSNKCIITNEILSVYWSSIHFFCVLMAFPTLTLITFGFLSYRNMHRLTHLGQLNGADRQLVLMVCLQLILVVISTMPYGIYNTYILITSSMIKTPEQIDQDFFFLTVTSLLGIFNFGGSFYVYLIASKRFRSIVGQGILCFWKRPNRTHPTTKPSVEQGNINHRNSFTIKAPM